ncbi:MAG: LysM peptidoglycan-binding domain-containing protein [Anaerolineae bacterium]|nr:LysM peptidoglycan-binding domain-containing protein [Anaerolineae bacterium]
MHDMSPEQSTAVAVSTPPTVLPVVTPTPTSPASPTSPVVVAATDTPTATPIPSATPLPPTEKPTDTPTIPTATSTALPPTSTATPTPEIPTPTPEPPPPPQPTASCPPPAGWVSYQVQVGDTLNSLGERTNTTVNNLYQANCLDSFTILPGQVIYLPFIPPTPTVTNTPTPVTPTPTPTRTGTPTATPYPPEIFGNEPTSGTNANEVVLAVLGRYFQPHETGFRVELRLGTEKMPLALGELKTSSGFEALVPIGLPPGTYDLWVINPDDQFDTRRSAYTSLAASP